jgi:hypothetical protein
MDWTVPFRDDQTCREFHHFDVTPDRAHRVAVFLDAYGVQVTPAQVAAGAADVRRRIKSHNGAVGRTRLGAQAQWVAEGLLERSEATSRWIESNSALFPP